MENGKHFSFTIEMSMCVHSVHRTVSLVACRGWRLATIRENDAESTLENDFKFWEITCVCARAVCG